MLVQRTLSLGKVEVYLTEALTYGPTLGAKLYDRFDIKSGRITSMLPDSLPERLWYDLGEDFIDTYEDDPLSVGTTVLNAAAMEAAAWLAHDQSACVVFQVPMPEMCSTAFTLDLMERDYRLLLHQDEVYAVVTTREQADSVGGSAFIAARSIAEMDYPRLVGVFALAPQRLIASEEERIEVTPDDLEYIASTTNLIMVGAYDALGYLFWRDFKARPGVAGETARA